MTAHSIANEFNQATSHQLGKIPFRRLLVDVKLLLDESSFQWGTLGKLLNAPGLLLSPVENGGAFRGKIWVKMAAHMCAVRRSDKMGHQPHLERLQRGARKCEEIWTSGSRFAMTCW